MVILGGGITGITAAYHFSKTGKSVVVLEASEVGKGTPGLSTGNLNAQVDTRLFYGALHLVSSIYPHMGSIIH